MLNPFDAVIAFRHKCCSLQPCMVLAGSQLALEQLAETMLAWHARHPKPIDRYSYGYSGRSENPPTLLGVGCLGLLEAVGIETVAGASAPRAATLRQRQCCGSHAGPAAAMPVRGCMPASSKVL